MMALSTWIGSVVFAAVIPFCGSSHKKTLSIYLDQICSSEKFYIKLNRYGGYIHVADSFAFHREGEHIHCSYVSLTLFTPPWSRDLSSQDLADIKRALTKRPGPLGRKRYDDFLTVSNGRETVVIADRNYWPRIADVIYKLIKEGE